MSMWASKVRKMFVVIVFPNCFVAGTSRGALDVLSSVAAEYFHNIGQTIRFLCDEFGNKMNPEVRVQQS